MSFKDAINPTGYVEIRDKRGKIIYKGFNTITNSGKTFIMEKLFSSLKVSFTDTESDDVNDNTNREFYGLCFSNCLDETTLDYSINPADRNGYDEYPENIILQNPIDTDITIEGNSGNSSDAGPNVAINPLFFMFEYNTEEGFDPGETDSEGKSKVANYLDLSSNTRRPKVAGITVCYDETFNKYYLAITANLTVDEHSLEVLKNNMQPQYPQYSEEGEKNEPIVFVSSIGILLSQYIDNKEVTEKNPNAYKKDLFSRFRFDAIPISIESEFSITYYIYI